MTEEQKEKKRIYQKKYREEHIEILKEKKKIYDKKYRAENDADIKAYRIENADTKKEYNKNYHLEHQYVLNEKSKKYGKEHPEIRRRNGRAYHKYHIENDPAYKIRHNLSKRLWETIKSNGGRKCNHTMELVGCSIKELMSHLESQFTEGMTFKNYGSWHVDHIRPCSSFNLINEEEQKACFNYKNLQPLWAVANLKKGDKWEGLIT